MNGTRFALPLTEGGCVNKRPHILVVEDETVLRRAIAQYYEERGVSVTEAASVAAAQTELRAASFDAVLLDVGLPDGSGLSLLKLVPADRALVISSTPESKMFRQLGIGHIPKPFDFAVLNRALDPILAS